MAWPVPGTAGVAGVRVYLWARVLWVFGSSGVGVSWVRLGRGIFFVRPGSYCGLRILCCAQSLLLGARPSCVVYSVYGRGPSGVACFGYSGWRVFCECPGLLCMCRGLVGHLLWSVWVLLCGAYSVRGLGLVAWRVPCFGFGFSCLL